MYGDHPPELNFKQRFGVENVLVLEEADKPFNSEHVIAAARGYESVYRDGDGTETFVIVFANQPRRIEHFTLTSLRSSLQTPRDEQKNKSELISMGDDALVLDCLDAWDVVGTNARIEVQVICYELEIDTIGQLFQKTRSELAGPQARYCGTKTLEYLAEIGRDFGKTLRG